jgi:uncharacterized protein (DUF2236 family)
VWLRADLPIPHQMSDRNPQLRTCIRTYGTMREVERAGRRVRNIHASLTGTDPDGTKFRLDEPDQSPWLHCAEVGSYVDSCRRRGMGVTPDQLDALVNEQRRPKSTVATNAMPGSGGQTRG